MKISVIITVFNLEKYVGQAIRSVLSQSCKPDEIIVVNDGSTDGSHEMIERFMDDIIYIRKEFNQGVLPGTLSAIERSSGDILMFLDGDDIWVDTKIEKSVAIFDLLPDVMLVTHNYTWIDKKGQKLRTVDATHKNLRKIGGSTIENYRQQSELLKDSILAYRGVWLGSAFAIRRKALNLTSFIEFLKGFNESYINLSHQDQPLAAYLIGAHPDKHLYFIDEILFYYRVYGANSSGNTSSKKMALATLRRSYATVAFTSHIVDTYMKSRKKALKIQAAHKYYLDYLNNLYSDSAWKALGYLIKAMPALSVRNTIKEFFRILVVLVVGSNVFFRIK